MAQNKRLLIQIVWIRGLCDKYDDHLSSWQCLILLFVIVFLDYLFSPRQQPPLSTKVAIEGSSVFLLLTLPRQR